MFFVGQTCAMLQILKRKNETKDRSTIRSFQVVRDGEILDHAWGCEILPATEMEELDNN